MKVAVSSAAFGAAFSTGSLSQLEWLDIAANEIEADGVVLDARDFPRTDTEYLAQLKKSATDLGLDIAALAVGAEALDDDALLARALALGAPLVIVRAPVALDDPSARSAFVANVKARARDAKRLGVVLAMRNVPGTMCASLGALRQLAADVDGSWLRFALDPLQTTGDDDPTKLLPHTVIACTDIAPATDFAHPTDPRAQTLITALARFRGHIVLELTDTPIGDPTYHESIARFMTLRNEALAK